MIAVFLKCVTLSCLGEGTGRPALLLTLDFMSLGHKEAGGGSGACPFPPPLQRGLIPRVGSVN